MRITDDLGRAAANGHRIMERLFDPPIVAVAIVRDWLGVTLAGANNLVNHRRLPDRMPVAASITAGWGHSAQGGITMPGHGRFVERTPAAEEQVPGLGASTLDVYLNDYTYWRNVPARVWHYTIGGYQVIKKWLSYREAKLLGRALKDEEAREVRDMARRIAAIVLLQPELDANYAAVAGDTYAWRSDQTKAQ